MKQITHLFLALSIITLAGCGKATPYKFKLDPKGKPIIRLQQQWYANSGFAGELWAAQLCNSPKTASKYNITLQVIQGSDQIDTKQVVMMGEAEFGVAGAEQIMQANERGSNFVVVGVINYQSLACFISKKDKGIMKPKDFEGHKIGTMEGSPVDMIYQVLKKKESLQIPNKDEVPTGWQLTGFVKGDYDVYPAFINDEPIKLRRQGVELSPPIEPVHYGVEFIGTVYFCKRALVQAAPDVVQSFVNAIADGWLTAMKDPKQATAYLKAYDKAIDEGKELESLVAGRNFYKGEDGKVLYCEEGTWNRMADTLKSIGQIKSFNYSTTVENKFVSWYHSNVAPSTQ